jgi:hypothetical protein
MGMVQEIRVLKKADPFVPYKVRTSAGKEFVIPGVDYIWTPPSNPRVVIFDDNDMSTSVPESKIASIEKIDSSAG